MLTQPAPEDVQGVHELMVERMPAFVYDCNYGNLESEIIFMPSGWASGMRAVVRHPTYTKTPPGDPVELFVWGCGALLVNCGRSPKQLRSPNFGSACTIYIAAISGL